MANERIIQIPTLITRNRPGDVRETDSAANGSAYITDANASGGAADWGVFTFTVSTQVLYTIDFSYTLASAPTSYRLTFQAPAGNSIVISGNALIGSSTTQFQVQLSGPPGDSVHSVRWEAFL